MPYSDDSNRSAAKDARQIAYQTLKGDILDLLLPPGAKLNEVDLAKALGMSRTPVRDILARLTREHLVDQIPHRGAFVAYISSARVDTAAWLWGELGTAVFDALYMEQIPRSDFLMVQHLLTQMQVAAEKRDYLSASRLFCNFYATFYRLAGLELSYEALMIATADYQRIIRLAERMEAAWDGILLECQSITEAVGDRNPSVATRALRHQTHRIQEICAAMQELFPAFFVGA